MTDSTYIDILSTITDLTLNISTTNDDNNSRYTLSPDPTSTSIDYSSSSLSTTDDETSISIESTIISTGTESRTDTDVPLLSTTKLDDDENFIFKLNESSSGVDDHTEVNKLDENYVIPLRIILPIAHIHASSENDTFSQFNYMILKVNDTAYHEHFAYDKPVHLFPANNSRKTTPTQFDNNSNVEMLNISNITTFTDNNQNEKNSALNKSQNDSLILTDSEGYRYQSRHQFKIFNETGALVVEFQDIEAIYSHLDDESETKKVTRLLGNSRSMDDVSTTPITVDDFDKYDEHYKRMMQWIHYYL